MRTFLVVIDSFGIGAMPDAAAFGDEGSDTYGNIFRETGVELPNLVSFGLNNIDGVAKTFSNGKRILPVQSPLAAYARLSEKTFAKDTTAGHYEIAGLVLEHPFRVFPNAFPQAVVQAIEKEAGTRFIGNEVASGTEIIQRLGEEHLKTGYPILYTSQDSVLQIAADTSVVPLQRLYEICKAARRVMTGELAVGRVIARPFVHSDGKFTRTKDRKDYSLEPPGETLLDKLYGAGIHVVSVGKIEDIFCGRGISEKHHTGCNAEGIDVLLSLSENLREGFVFVNLVDTDMLYGHRNNVCGYADALKIIDKNIKTVYENLREGDLLLITADHGCDPTTPSTDHSREYVPLLICGKDVCPQNLGTIEGFDFICDLILARYGLRKRDERYRKIFGGEK